jgi:hypothetical protein
MSIVGISQAPLDDDRKVRANLRKLQAPPLEARSPGISPVGSYGTLYHYLLLASESPTPPSHAFGGVGTGRRFDKSVVQTDRSALPLCDMYSASQGDLYAGAANHYDGHRVRSIPARIPVGF